MATKRVDFVVSEKGAAKTKQGLKGVDAQLVAMAKSAASVAVAMVALRKGAELTKLAADAVNVEKAFRNLSKEPDKMLQAMKKAVGGTIQEFELMKQFNQAALLGLPLDRFDEMLAIARSSAQATGQSMDFMLNSIVTGIGRQSRLMIDNLGLIVSIGDANEVYAQKLGKLSSELTQLEQKTAFANAVLDAGAKNIAKMGGSAEGAFDGVKALTSLVQDKTTNAFKNLVSPVNTVAAAWVKIANSTRAEWWDDVSRGMLNAATESKALAFQAGGISRLVGQIESGKIGSLQWGNALKALNLDFGKQSETKKTLIPLLEKEIKAIEATISGLRVKEGLDAEALVVGSLMNRNREEQSGLIANEISLFKELPALLDNVKFNFQGLTDATDMYVDSMVGAIVHGQSMKDALISASKALTVQLISDFIKRKITTSIGLSTTTAETILAAQAIGAAWATPAALAATATAGVSAVSGGTALAATVAASNAIAQFGDGGDFVTSGPQIIMVGERGKEHVQVTPLEGPNINGPQGGVTINFYGDVIGTDDYIENNLIPAVNLAITQGRAALA